MNDSTVRRIQGHLSNLSTHYPKCWQHLEHFRQSKGYDLPDWPDWCYVPVAACYGIVSRGKVLYDFEKLMDVALMQALAGWRLTQGIYRFDPEIYQELTSTSFSGQMPNEILYSLPEWTVYIELQEDYAHGVFATLEYDVNDHHSELRLIYDTSAGIFPRQIHLVGTLEEGIQASIEYSNRHMGMSNLTANAMDKLTSVQDTADSLSRQIGSVVSLVLYLCSEKPDLETQEGSTIRPSRPNPVKTKKGYRYFPAKKETIWQTGYRLGEFLRKSKEDRLQDQGGTHASPAPHVRRAHWHTYWTGPLKDPEKKQPLLKWIPPTPVGFDWSEGNDVLVPMVKRVK